MNEWRMERSLDSRLQKHLEWCCGVTLRWTRPEVCSGSDHLQDPQKVCHSCYALGLWSLQARTEKDRNHHIARAQLNSCRAPGLPSSFLGNVPSQLLLMGSVFLTDKHFSPWYKNSWIWHIVLISIKWQLQFTKGWCQLQTQTSLCNGSI